MQAKFNLKKTNRLLNKATKTPYTTSQTKPMKKTFLFTLLSIISFYAFAQDEILNISINTEFQKEHVIYLSSEKCEGRRIGTSGLDSAANYISALFKSFGLESITGENNKNSFYEKFQIYLSYRDSSNEATINTNNKTLRLFYDFDTGSNDHTSKTEEAEIIYGYNKDKLTNYDLSNMFVAILDNKGRAEREQIISDIKKAGAKGAIKIWNDDKKYSPEYIALKKEVTFELNFGLYYLDVNTSEFFTFSMPKSSAAKLFNISLNSFNRAINLYEKGKENKLSDKSFSFTFNLPKKIDTVNVKNIIGLIPGTDLKNEVIVISAHYDHLGKGTSLHFSGADDNASGVSVLLETARIFGELYKNNIKPRRTIAFIAFTAEEQGLLGSEFLLERDSILNPSDIIANINVDMVGRGSNRHDKSPNQLYILGNDFNTKLLDLPDSINNIHSHLFLDYKYTKDDPRNYFEKSDQFSFIKQNIPSVFFFGGTHPDLHTANDTYDKINFERLKKVSLLTFYTLWEVANINKL